MSAAPDLPQLILEAEQCYQARRLGDAERLYRQILSLDERHDASWHRLALIALEYGRTDIAASTIAKAITLRGDVGRYHATRGAVFESLGRLETAAASYRQAVTLDPGDAATHALLGTALGRLGKLEEAAASYAQALALKPDDASTQYNVGLALEKQGKYDQALAAYEQALKLNPASAEIHNSLSMVLFALSRLDEALAAAERALELKPGYADAWNNRGTALLQLHRPAEALACYERTLGLSPSHAVGLMNRGNILVRLKRRDEALCDYARAQSLRPDLGEAHWGEALCRLYGGDFPVGWQKYEWRWHIRPYTVRTFASPLWLGAEDIAGKTILLHGEQGYGDALQFCRYVPLVAARGATVVVEVPDVLKPLMSGIEGATAVYAQGDVLPDTDFHCPLLSLPLALGTTIGTIPAHVPYLAAPAEAAARWRERLRDISRPRIGLCWRAGERHQGELHRSLLPALLAPLLDCGVTVVSLQKDQRPEDQEWLAAHPAILDFNAELTDFADTAALAAELDLVITVDTSVAHLAGALGLPVWIMLSYIGDWRWMHDREDSPWYPTARLYRQTEINDWTGVIARIAASLCAFAGEKPH